MPNSTLLRPAIAAYCQWAESIRDYEDLRKDDCAVDEIRHNAAVCVHALAAIRAGMISMFQNVCNDVLSARFGCSYAILAYDTGSGLAVDSGLPIIRGKFVDPNGLHHEFTIDHNCALTILF